MKLHFNPICLKATIAVVLLSFLGIAQATAGTVNLRFANSNCTGTQYCTTVQMQASTGSLKVGNGTVFFSYNTQSIANPTFTALNFDSADGYGFAPQFFSLETGNSGEGNYNILLGSAAGSPSLSVTTEWVDVAQFCFTVVSTAQTPNLQFVNTYTGFNSEANAPASSHTLGTTTGNNASFACSTAATVQLKVFLEGPFSVANLNMSKSLNTGGNIPLTQPYTGAPYNYNGGESIATVPTEMVDWVLVQASNDPNNTSNSDIVATKAAILLTNGSIVNTDGSTLSFSGLPGNNYYFIVRHRNHLAIVTPTSVTIPTAAVVDLTTSTQTFASVQQTKQMGTTGIYAMKAGNGDGNMTINIADRNAVWRPQNSLLGYRTGDYDMNGNVNVADRNAKWRVNNGQFGVTSIAP